MPDSIETIDQSAHRRGTCFPRWLAQPGYAALASARPTADQSFQLHDGIGRQALRYGGEKRFFGFGAGLRREPFQH